ncbi:uncharacterized protein LOC126972071 isoform X2 [Leptidea sinapis]|uniref:uncharacterized protein LOC126972071 isoform X2 n=1 Tax=Leptidea sinapis TaxID=189913 RepID=UPI0021C263ED|nr:uncharacterized protein LOC126972071 isoform X2 [Leptidea sinapis]
MKCFIILIVIHIAFGSIIELNDTDFARLPPLYDLDDWSKCQQPNDKYCVVDAVLLARSPSPVYQLLQEYSSQSLKHYNRSQIHRGVCVSRCDGNTSDWRAAAEKCVNETVQQYGLEAELLNATWCSTVGESRNSQSSQVLWVVVILLLVLTLLATGLHILGDKCGRCDGNKYLMAFSLKKNWHILNYDRSKPRHDARMKDLACLEGMRYIGIQCVIFAHVILIYVYSYIDNPQFIEKTFDSIVWKIVLNSPVWIQAFFSISGFLMAYTSLIVSEKTTLTFGKCLLSILYRWIRLTPVAIFALWFTIAWYPQLGSGPQWAWIVDREAHDCSERWWYHVLYVHNHIPLGKFCMGHTWYLAVDMQLHIIGILVLLLLMRYPFLTSAVLAFLLLATTVAAGCVTYLYQLSPIITAQSPDCYFQRSSDILFELINTSKAVPPELDEHVWICMRHGNSLHSLPLPESCHQTQPEKVVCFIMPCVAPLGECRGILRSDIPL